MLQSSTEMAYGYGGLLIDRSYFREYFKILYGRPTFLQVIYVTALAPYVFLIIFLIRGMMLPGSLNGILFYITPNFSALLNPRVGMRSRENTSVIDACSYVMHFVRSRSAGEINRTIFFMPRPRD